MYSSSYAYTSSPLHNRKYTCFAAAPSQTITQPSHEGLLDRLVFKADEDERKLKTLLDAYDLEYYYNDSKTASTHFPSSNLKLQNHGRLRGFSTPEGLQQAHNMDNLLISDEIRDKYDYLSTPIRRRYFPKLSPNSLKVILSTPPTRASTPNNNTSLEYGQRVSAESSARRDTPTDPFTSTAGETHSTVAIGAESSANLFLGGPCDEASYHVSCSGLSMLPLTPPSSNELPTLESFPSLGNNASRGSVSEAIRVPSPGSCYHPNLVPKNSIDHSKTAASKSYSSPFLTPDRRDIDADLYSASSSDTIHFTAALRQHSHGELSSAALRNFQRVINELQGSESEALDRSGLNAASPQLTSVTHPSGDHALDRKIPKHVIDVSEDCDPMNHSSSILDSATVEDCTSSSDIQDMDHRTANVCSLDQEFASLLLERAFEDDSFASRLMLLARRFERMAMQRRQLASTAMSKSS